MRERNAREKPRFPVASHLRVFALLLSLSSNKAIPSIRTFCLTNCADKLIGEIQRRLYFHHYQNINRSDVQMAGDGAIIRHGLPNFSHSRIN